MSVPFLDLPLQYRVLKPEMDPVLEDTMQNAQFILGPRVKAFEEAFATYCGARHCVGLNSGTSALQLLLLAHGIGPGDECILPANTFFATAEAVLQVGATPVLVDCEEESALMDLSTMERAVTGKTKAILPVHLFGQPVDIDAVLAIARPRNILVIEDACQAHGAMLRGRRVGGLAASAAFSFYPGKNLGAYGDAGGITTNDDAVARTVRLLREHGMERKYVHEMLGWNERMDGIQGAVLNVKLPHLDAWNDARRAHAAAYREYLNGVGDIRFITELPDRTAVYHLFVIRSTRRDALQKHLTEHGIQTGIHYPIPLHLLPALASLEHLEGDFPATEALSREMLSLPMFPELTSEQIKEVCSAIKSFFA